MAADEPSTSESDDPLSKEVFDRLFGPRALVVALETVVREYARAVEEGRAGYPAHRRESPNVADVWSDLRTEAFWSMVGFGKANLMLLAESRLQTELLGMFVSERALTGSFRPTGEEIGDTVHGVWRVYDYLQRVGSELCDPSTDKVTLELKRGNILDQFMLQAEALQEKWNRYEFAVRADQNLTLEMPNMIIDLLYADVTAKAKSIAISCRFGPDPETTLAVLLDSMADNGGPNAVAAARRSIERMRNAQEPEDVHDPTRRESNLL